MNLCLSTAYSRVTAKGRDGRVHHITDLDPDHFQTTRGVWVDRGVLRLAEGDFKIALVSFGLRPVSADLTSLR